MCYSVKTSIISYTLGIAAAVFAFATRQIVLGMLILAYCQMQLSEILIWHGIDTNNLKLNRFGTSFGKYLLAVHNIAIGLGIILSVLLISKKKLTPTYFIPLIAGVLFFLVIVFTQYLPKTYPDVTFPLRETCRECQNPENRLRWPYPHEWYIFSYLLSLIIMVAYTKPSGSKLVFILFFSASFILSAFIFPRTVGSVWCFSTAILAPLVVLINYLLIRNQPNKNLLT